MVQSAGLLELDEASALTRRLSDASIASTVGNGSTATNGAHHGTCPLIPCEICVSVDNTVSCDMLSLRMTGAEDDTRHTTVTA